MEYTHKLVRHGHRLSQHSALPKGRPDSLAVARWNTASLMAFLYLQDIFWFVASRFQAATTTPAYRIIKFDWTQFLELIFFAVLFAICGVAAAYVVRPLKKRVVPNWWIKAIILFSIVLNFSASVLLLDNARYVSGGLTGTSGVVYGLGNAFSLGSMLLFIRAIHYGKPLPRYLLLLFFASLAVRVDGLAVALTIATFAVIVFDVRIRRPGRVFLAAILALGFFWLGISAKFTGIPEFLTLEFLLSWVVSRFSIQAEQMYTFLTDKSFIGNFISYSDLVLRSMSDRWQIVMGDSPFLRYPRSVSEALYYDLNGKFGAGSSPGALLGTMLQGFYFFVPILFFAFLFLQYFDGVRGKVTILHLCAYSFLFKGIHSNFSEYFTVVSVVPLLAVIFLLMSVCRPKHWPANR